MEPSEFQVLMKHYYFKEKTVAETKAKLDKYYLKSAPSLQLFTNGLEIFIVKT